MNNKIKKHIKILGKVQGVGYRFWLQAFAIRYGVFGWVRNNPNGQVEAFMIGDEEIITNLIFDTDEDYDAKSFEIMTDN